MSVICNVNNSNEKRVLFHTFESHPRPGGHNIVLYALDHVSTSVPVPLLMRHDYYRVYDVMNNGVNTLLCPCGSRERSWVNNTL